MGEGGVDADSGLGSLVVLIDSSGSGTVTSDPPGIDCGKACFATYPLGTKVTLTATADALSVFGGFTGSGCSGTGPCTVTIVQDTGVIATFGTLSGLGDAGIDDAGADASVVDASRAATGADAAPGPTITLSGQGGCAQASGGAAGDAVVGAIGILVCALVAISRSRGRARRSARRGCGPVRG